MNTDHDESFLRTIFEEHDPADALDSSAGPVTDGESFRPGTPKYSSISRDDSRRGRDTRSANAPQKRLPDARTSQRPGRRGPLVAASAAAAVALIAVLATGGFGLLQIQRPASTSEESQPDVSAHGRVAYACTLALDAHKHGDMSTWRISPGEDSGPAYLELAAVPGLLSALAGAAPEGHPELRDPAINIARGIDSSDLVKGQAGLDDLATWCREHPEARAQMSVDAEDRADYACALAVDAASYGRIDVDAWGITVGDEAGTPWREITAIPGLLGVNVGARPEGQRALGEVGDRIASALTKPDLAAAQTALDDLVTQCRR